MNYCLQLLLTKGNLHLYMCIGTDLACVTPVSSLKHYLCAELPDLLFSHSG